MKSAYRDIHPISKLGVTTLVALVCLVIFMILSAVLAIPIFGLDAFSGLVSSTLKFDESNITLLKYFQIAQSVGLFIVPALIVAYLFGNGISNYLSLNKKPFLISSVLAILIVFSASPLINMIGLWNAEMSLPHWMSGIENWMRQSEDSATKLTELFVHAENFKGLLFNVFLIGVIPAIGEEFLFRGVIQRIFTEWTKNKHIAIWITAILFSALHLQFFGFLPRAILGAMFGYLFIWSGNLWLPVIAHFINNTTAVIAYYLYQKGQIKMDPDTIGTNSEYGIAAIFSLLIIVGLFTIYYRFENNKKLKIDF